jgi:hypothetical protein
MQLTMRPGNGVVFCAPQAGRMVFAADFRDLAITTVVSPLDEKLASVNTLGKLRNRVFDFFADLIGEFFGAE